VLVTLWSYIGRESTRAETKKNGKNKKNICNTRSHKINFVTRNFVTKEPTVILIVSGKFVPERLSSFARLEVKILAATNLKIFARREQS
jgi:hypothetical protein